MSTDSKLEALNRLLGDSAEMSGWRKEADDTDALLRHLGLDPDACRTEAGWLNLPHIKTLLAEQEQAGEAVAWLVIDSTGQPMHAAWWEAAAHEHINDAINEYDLHEASEWRVVPVYSRPLEPLNQTKLIALWADKSDGPSNAEIVSFARAIERAHGITKEPKT